MYICTGGRGGVQNGALIYTFNVYVKLKCACEAYEIRNISLPNTLCCWIWLRRHTDCTHTPVYATDDMPAGFGTESIMMGRSQDYTFLFLFSHYTIALHQTFAVFCLEWPVNHFLPKIKIWQVSSIFAYGTTHMSSCLFLKTPLKHVRIFAATCSRK